MNKLILLFICLLQLSFAYANNLASHFEETFFTHYVPRKCGENILAFLERADKKGLNVYNAHILEITNVGFSVFGLVNAEWVRARDRRRTEPREHNWSHHVVLEHDGLIYDFDFGNSPVPLPIKSYFEKMFLKEKRLSEGGEFYVGREEKLKNYQILVRPGLETLRAFRSGKPTPTKVKLRLKDYLGY